MSTIYKIHPAIGIARVGTSDDFCVTPEVSGGLPTDPGTGKAVTSLRDKDGNLLKQAQRFRVFSYDSKKPDDPGTEVRAGLNGVKAIEWTVYLANKKAVWYEFKQLTGSGQEGDKGYVGNGPKTNPLRNKSITSSKARQALILDPGPRTVGGKGNPTSASFDLSGDVTDPKKMLPFPVTSLGAAKLDANGNLFVIGGDGASGTLNTSPAGSPYQYVLLTYANNDGWFDDAADGPVTASIVLDNGKTVPVDVPAWCLSGPPKYAPQLSNLVTLHDLMYDIAVREMNYAPKLFSGGAFNTNYEVNFAAEIAPVIGRPAGYRWLVQIPKGGTRAHAALPTDGPTGFPIGQLRAPDALNANNREMPILAGDNPITNDTISKYLSVTQTQYFLIQQWVAGKVMAGPPAPPPLAAQLDQAALDSCVGGAFCPGIEMTWISRNKSIYAAPFRIRMSKSIKPGKLSQTNGDNNDYSKGLEPGDIIKYMAQPWQADFNECSIQPITNDPKSNSKGSQKNFWWWPAERPYDVFVDPAGLQVEWTRGFEENPTKATEATPNIGDMQMVVNWKDLGFVTKSGNTFIETERKTAAIDAYKPPLKP
ncbi:MAG: hypothetical protein QOC81_2582 [Thermoanaerobaculia bacterium]|jgi:hypothetical protein|nr:hypothetical protein [Thermoanaerobaculia bacterium]